MLEPVAERAHPGRHHVGDHTLVVLAVAGQEFHPVRTRPYDLDPHLSGYIDDLGSGGSLGIVCEVDTVDLQVRVAECGEYGPAAVDREIAVAW